MGMDRDRTGEVKCSATADIDVRARAEPQGTVENDIDWSQTGLVLER